MIKILGAIVLLPFLIISRFIEFFVQTPVSTIIGVVAFIGCISAFGPFGLLSLIFIWPFIMHFYNVSKNDNQEKKN